MESKDSGESRGEDPLPLSAGSESHPRNCRACTFVYSNRGCGEGENCKFCHHPSHQEERPRYQLSRFSHLRRRQKKNTTTWLVATLDLVELT